MSHLLNYGRKYGIVIFCVLIAFFSHAQSEIPLGAWRLHVSYNTIHTVSLGNNYAFGASENGIVVVDRADNSISTYSKLNGLLGAGITSIIYDSPTNQLIVAYKDGRIDLIHDGSITSRDPAGNSTITGSKKINHIALRDNLAYLAADYGVIIFDLSQGDVKETWRDIGVDGQTVKVFQSTFKDDSIFLATDQGILAGDLRENLLDFNFWKHFNAGDFIDSVQSVAAFNGKVYASVNKSGMYRYEAGQWIKEGIFENEPVISLNASAENLLVSAGTALWRLSASNSLTQVVTDKIERPNMAIEESSGQIWIADGRNGIVSNPSSGFVNYLPNGPSNSLINKLAYDDGKVHALGGSYPPVFSPLMLPGWIDQFSQGVWSTQQSTMHDLTDIEFDDQSARTFIASFGDGVEERDELTSLQIFNETNSPLTNTNPPSGSVFISDMQKTNDGLWIANYGAAQPLHFLSTEYAWSSYALSPIASRYPTALAVDFYNSVWLILNPEEGGGVTVFNKENSSSRYLTNLDGSGGLPSRSVRCVAVDRDGIVWLGTDEGVCYFVDPAAAFSPSVNAVKPIFENRFLLRDDKVTTIAVDGGNRKWIGTERGVWLFSASGEELIHNFTTDNSPLLSNTILDIEINDKTGEVFFATAQGLVSFRADATESDFQFQTIKIFPNPVTPGFNGTVGISGLATDAIVKITDIAGKLVWETRANGGTASWNVRDYRGKRAATGIYLVFSASADGSEREVGKIAVVE